MKRKLLFISVLLILVACTPSKITIVEINSVKIPVELAITPEQKTTGLMSRTNLTGGMLFVYDDEQPRIFWMKDTLIPLDMIFINKNKEIVTIHHAQPCVEDPCKIYPSKPAQYVLEVNYDFTRQHNITEGTRVSFIS